VESPHKFVGKPSGQGRFFVRVRIYPVVKHNGIQRHIRTVGKCDFLLNAYSMCISIYIRNNPVKVLGVKAGACKKYND